MSDVKRKYHDALDDALDRPVAFNPAFKKITGSTVAALFLSQAWYWSKRHANDDGWFYKSQKEWQDETGLSRSEQETARKHCLRVGVIEEKLKGVPATMHYRVNKPKVYELLGVQFAEIQQTENDETPQTEIAKTPQTSFSANRKYAGKLQSDVYSNFNKVTETPPTIPLVIVVNANIAEISTLYEKEFGGLTPMIADAIGDAVDTYPPDWIPEAMQIAVAGNKRNWKYVEGILRNCKEKNVRPRLNKLENQNGNQYQSGNRQRAKSSRPSTEDAPVYSDADRAAAQRVRERNAKRKPVAAVS